MVSSLLCPLCAFLTPLYAILSLTAVASQTIPFLRDLASHGKTRRDDGTTSGSISTVNNKRSAPLVLMQASWVVPKSYFSHFYTVGLVSTLACVLYQANYHSRDTTVSTATSTSRTPLHVAALSLLLLHLLRRWFECRYVHSWHCMSRMHVAGYLLGILHYLVLPLVFVDLCQEDVFQTTGVDSFAVEGALSALSFPELLQLFLGTSICVGGQYQQYRHHAILAKLRDTTTTTTTSTTSSTATTTTSRRYSLPFGGWFWYVSCPHYLAEMLVYVGFVILLCPCEFLRTDTTRTASRIYHLRTLLLSLQRYRCLALLLWVTTNLSVSAVQSHRWYMQRFPQDYPLLQRYAVIPHIL